jgi:hypothetical protein
MQAGNAGALAPLLADDMVIHRARKFRQISSAAYDSIKSKCPSLRRTSAL